MRRSIPGPAGGSYRAACPPEEQQQQQQQQQEEDAPEPATSLFSKKSWLSLCRALDVAVPPADEPDLWEMAIKQVLPCTISDIKSGACDMRVPKLAAVVAGIRHSPNADVIVELADPTGRIEGYLHRGIAGVPPAHSAVLLEQVAIVIANTVEIERVLNIHHRCLLTVIPDETEVALDAAALQTDEL